MLKFIANSVFILLSVAILFSMVSCGKLDQLEARYTGEPPEVCVDGVVYLQFTSGVSVKYDEEGYIATCNKLDQK